MYLKRKKESWKNYFRSIPVHLSTFNFSLFTVVFVQSLCPVRLFATPCTAASQASRSFSISQSLLKFMSIDLVMPSNYLIFCFSLLLLPSLFPSIRVFYCFILFNPYNNSLCFHLYYKKIRSI